MTDKQIVDMLEALFNQEPLTFYYRDFEGELRCRGCEGRANGKTHPDWKFEHGEDCKVNTIMDELAQRRVKAAFALTDRLMGKKPPQK